MASRHWINMSGGHIPANAVVGGEDNGETMYVGRADHEGDTIPGKVVPSHNCCYVAWGGEEHAKQNYQVLCYSDQIKFDWRKSGNGNLSPGALKGGRRSDGGFYYIGRAMHEGCLVPGKIHVEHQCAYLPWGGKENRADEYEVLVADTIDLI